jgi:hypothetical protein
VHLSKFSQGVVKVHGQGKANLNRGFINAAYREKADATPPIAELGRRLVVRHLLEAKPYPPWPAKLSPQAVQRGF